MPAPGVAYGLQVSACCEAKDLTAFGVGRASCIDRAVIEDILGGSVTLKPDKGQRKGCGCYESIDIGAITPVLMAVSTAMPTILRSSGGQSAADG